MDLEYVYSERWYLERYNLDWLNVAFPSELEKDFSSKHYKLLQAASTDLLILSIEFHQSGNFETFLPFFFYFVSSYIRA